MKIPRRRKGKNREEKKFWDKLLNSFQNNPKVKVK
jgi:hypothetical protein